MKEFNAEHLNHVKNEFVRVLELRIKDCLENSEFVGSGLYRLLPNPKRRGNVVALGVMITMVHRLKSVNSVEDYDELANLVWGNYPVIASDQLLKALLQYPNPKEEVLSKTDISWVTDLCSPSYYLNHLSTKLYSLSSKKDSLHAQQVMQMDKATKVIEEFQAAHAELMELLR